MEKYRIYYGETAQDINEPVIIAAVKKIINEEIKPSLIDKIEKAKNEIYEVLKSKGYKGDEFVIYISYSARLFPSYFKLTVRVHAVRDGTIIEEKTVLYEKEYQGNKLYEDVVKPKLRPYEELEEFYLDP
jgi:hypothetical protein